VRQIILLGLGCVVTVAAAVAIVTIEASKIIWRTFARTDSTICTSGFYVGTKCTCLLAYMKTAVAMQGLSFVCTSASTRQHTLDARNDGLRTDRSLETRSPIEVLDRFTHCFVASISLGLFLRDTDNSNKTSQRGNNSTVY
jgi:hypothetical protein